MQQGMVQGSMSGSRELNEEVGRWVPWSRCVRPPVLLVLLMALRTGLAPGCLVHADEGNMSSALSTSTLFTYIRERAAREI